MGGGDWGVSWIMAVLQKKGVCLWASSQKTPLWTTEWENVRFLHAEIQMEPRLGFALVQCITLKIVRLNIVRPYCCAVSATYSGTAASRTVQNTSLFLHLLLRMQPMVLFGWACKVMNCRCLQLQAIYEAEHICDRGMKNFFYIKVFVLTSNHP